ncbi:MAG: DNA-binding protein [Methylophaga sp.]|nr:MAG: DNA-binding protein [Methylophaga sp.]
MTEQQNLITPVQAAEYLGVSVRTLNKWRSDGSVKIPFKRVGRACRYSVTELDSYLSQNSFNSMTGN